ncbi:MAG: hypothetical protein HON90_03465 [Halobacteriovoraceae bacterium]|jgi:hypothetical protein|nr:hypothetical protein [Halobacteriovoraceae bacterium]
MPDNVGVPTDDEINHYAKVIHESQITLNTMKAKEFDRVSFDTAHAALLKVYNSFENPYLSQKSDLWNFPQILKTVIDGGRFADSVTSFQEEIVRAEVRLKVLKTENKNHPMKKALSQALGKKD